MHEVNLGFRQMTHLLSHRVQIRSPVGQQGMQLMPMLLCEGSVHRWRHMNDLKIRIDYLKKKYKIDMTSSPGWIGRFWRVQA